MKFHFKQVGDKLSLDEYNALCYLLSKQTYTENIVLEPRTKEYKYGKYKLSDTNYGIIEKHDGYVIHHQNVPLVVTISHNNPNANYYLNIKVVKQKTITENGITTTLYPVDMIDVLEDNIHDTKYDITYDHIKLKATKINQNTSKITFIPENYGLKNDDYISANAVIRMMYDEPIINYADGSIPDDDEYICKNFKELYDIIMTSPRESQIKIKLKGNTTYTFDKTIKITDKKQVYITGGNYTNNAYSILDGQDEYRLFHVDPDCTLSVENCKFYRGNGENIHDTSELHKKGGAINMHGRYENIGEVNGLHVAMVNVKKCVFESCHAERGGAIFNMRGKLNIESCEFNKCKATSTTNSAGAFGGAIMCESIPVYAGASNTININPSVYTTGNNQSVIQLKISTLQNLNYFTASNFTLPTMKLRYNGSSYNATFQKLDNQFNYTVTVPIVLPNNAEFYFYTTNFNRQPSLCTRLLHTKEISGTKYVEVKT